MLVKIGATPATDLIYPLIRYSVRDLVTGFTAADGFHDLWSEDDNHLAGMGLAILGNVLKLLARGAITPLAHVSLLLVRSPSEFRALPWPGMPDAQPIDLDLGQLPFDPGMFLGDDQAFPKVLSRWELLYRIKTIWVPELRRVMGPMG